MKVIIPAIITVMICLQAGAGTVEGAGNSVKKAIRKADDKVCEMFNGKLKCVAKRVKHAVENAKDSISADSNELKSKVEPEK